VALSTHKLVFSLRTSPGERVGCFLDREPCPVGAVGEAIEQRDVAGAARFVLYHGEQERLQGLTSGSSALGQSFPHIFGNVSDLQGDHACIIHVAA